MDTNKLIKFFEDKLEKVPELKQLQSYEDPVFKEWWNIIKATCERMGDNYSRKVRRIRFTPSVIVGDSRGPYYRAYQSGLSDAEALIKSFIADLEMWGFNGVPAASNPVQKSSGKDGPVVLNLTISQQQSQEIVQTINLSQYDKDVQDKVEELLAELRKPSKDNSKIINTVKWLADKGSDALIAILLASTHLTR